MAQGRIPPHNSEAEQAILGAILIDKDSISELSQKVKPDYFYENAHQEIFAAMIDLYEERKPIDVLSLSNLLKKKQLLERVGGGTFITTLASSASVSLSPFVSASVYSLVANCSTSAKNAFKSLYSGLTFL